MPIFSSTVNDLQSGASFRFDGINDVVTVADNDGIDLGSNSFTVSYWIKDSTVYATGVNGGFVSKFGGGIGWAIYSSYGNLTIFVDDGTTEQACHYYTNSWANGEWRNFVWSVDRTTNVIKMYLDGVETTISNSGSISGISDNTLSNSGNFLIGQDSFSTYKMKGEISSVRVHNRALTADEVVDSYNGQMVPYEYRGAGNINTSNVFVFKTGSGTSFLDLFTAVNQNVTVYKAFNNFEENLQYKIIFTVNAGENSSFYLNMNDASDATGGYTGTFVSTSKGSISSGTNVVLSDSGDYEVVVEDVEDVESIQFMSFSGNSVTVSAFKIIKQGCIAEFLPTGISADRWVDTSGNDLHGTVTGAIATNHKRGSLTTKNIKTTDMTFTGTVTGSSLDSYETGTWTPFFLASTTDFSSITYAYNTAMYTRIGDIVHIQGGLATDNITVGSAAGYLLMGGLPYKSLDGYSNCFSLGFAYNWASDQTPMTLRVSSGSTVAYFDRMLANSSYVGFGAILQYNALKDGTSSNWIQFGGTYRIKIS